MTTLITLPAGHMRDRGWSERESAAVASVMDAYEVLVGGADPAAVARLYDRRYRDHASTVAGHDLEGLSEFVRGFRESFPGATIAIEQVLADGDHVFVRTRARRAPEDAWDQVMEVFCLQDGLISEHWEVIENASATDDTATIDVSSADGTRIAVRSWGPENAEPVVFLHGVSSSSMTYDWLPPTITAGRRTVTLDFRGHGRSAHRPGTYTLPHYTEDVVAVLERAVRRPAVVVGFSLGATVAWTLAQKRPDLVRAVFLEEPIIFPDDVYSGPIPDTLRSTIEQERDWTARGLDADRAAIELAAQAAGPGVTMGDLLVPQEVRTLTASMLVRDRGTVEAAIDRSMTADVDAHAPVQVPTEILAGGDALGSVFGTKHATALAATHPDVTVHRIPQSGHLVHNSVAGRPPWTALLAAFLERHAPRVR
jgi:pimeloyl-ACP methyl ester carboxylesterase/predicted SnoaL-like aldol condensation-catalyzing enzyme